MFQRICIIGFGLIGSSLARALRQNGLARAIVCADSSPDTRAAVRELGLADVVTDDLAAGAAGADLVILCVPVGAMADVARQIGPSLAPGVIVSDVGSVKAAVTDALRPLLPAHVSLVPGHPIAGTEHSGPRAGFAELFTNRWCILTPPPGTDEGAVAKMTALWRACGAKVEIMTPSHHDLVLGITSHLPHLIAFTVVGTATDLEGDLKSKVIEFSASGFRDFTRIAASDPVMWRDIFLNNKDAVLDILQRFNEDLTALQKAIRRGDGDYLYETFKKTRDIRRAIIDVGQAEK